MDVGLFSLLGYRTPGTDTASIYDTAVAQVKAAEAAASPSPGSRSTISRTTASAPRR